MRCLLWWLRVQWGFGPVFAVQCVLLALDALHELDEATERQQS